ncbi:hypothetical protein TSUD_239020 [Trifolium subterraneum]|uniref:Uncharacterized protein n=1 Tax=Trifolium subterraneum TaxID=3900 RepID=A0A2Z6NBP9_TRISU|nr:hypothetical protein TSUD_239020 [Trifolium subterraneum]
MKEQFLMWMMELAMGKDFVARRLQPFVQGYIDDFLKDSSKGRFIWEISGAHATSYESEGNDALPGSVAIMFTVAAVSEQGKCSLALEYETQEVQIPIEIPLSSFLSPLPPLHLVIPVKGVTKGIAEVGGRSLTIAGGYEQESY